MMLFDDGSAQSLITQIGQRRLLRMPDTFDRERSFTAPGLSMQVIGTLTDGTQATVSMTDGGLVMLEAASAEPHYVSRLSTGPAPSWVKLSQWWTGPALARGEMIYTRQEIVRYVRHTDGGGHVAAYLDARYVAALEDNLDAMADHGRDDLTRVPTSDPRWTPARANVVAATLRQIAYEALLGLRAGLGGSLLSQ